MGCIAVWMGIVMWGLGGLVGENGGGRQGEEVRREERGTGV